MRSSNRNKSTKKVQAMRSLRSNGPATGVQDVHLADSATSGPHWTGIALNPIDVDPRTNLEATPATEQAVNTITASPLKIKIRRGVKGLDTQLHPGTESLLQDTGTLKGPGSGAATTDPPVGMGQDNIVVPEGQDLLTAMEAEDTDIEEIIRPSQKRLAAVFPQPKPETSLEQFGRYRKYIKDRGVPLDKPFANVSEALLRNLEDAEKTLGGPKRILTKVTRIAQKVFTQEASSVLKDDDTDQESGAERQDDGGEEYSQDLLECVRRMMSVEARIREPSNTESQAGQTRKKTTLKGRKLSKNPPGGLLNISGVPGESIPAMAGLRIEQYSNAAYWKFVPYLESEFCTELEQLYQPNTQGLYSVEVDDLKRARTALERKVVKKKFAMRNDKPSLRLAPDDEAMEETTTSPTNGTWECYIMNHLISCCDVGGLGRIDVDTCPSDEGGSIGEEEENPRCIKRVKLTQEDLQVAVDLWDEVINPKCIEFEKRTGKPAEAMREAIAGVIARRVNQGSGWNAWQKIWWKKLPKVHDKGLRKQLGDQCREEYQARIKELDTQEAIDAWTRTLEDDLAEQHDLDAQGNAAKKVVDIEDELVAISRRAARDHVHILFFACSVNPYSLQAQAMSGVGVGSQEMRSVLVDNGQLLPLHLMLNDLKTKVGNLELQNRKAGILPPAFGSGGMLNLPEHTGTERLDPLTKFKLFECGSAIGPSESIPPAPKAYNRGASRSRKKPHVGDYDNESDSNGSIANTADQLPPLLVDNALARAVSQVKMPMDGWASLHIFKLFVVLVEPPPGLNLIAIKGLHDYLTQLLVKIGDLVENGRREIASRCWCTLLALCSNKNVPRKRADWVPILKMLEKSSKRLINWCPSVSFPISGGFPRSRQTYRNMLNMFFNADPARRLRLVPIEGPINDDTPIIVNPVVLGGDCSGCTVAQTITTVEHSTASQWSQLASAIREPGPIRQSAAAMSTTQGLGVPLIDPLPIDLDLPVGPGTFDPSDPFSLPPGSFFAPGASTRIYESNAQSLSLSPLATLGPNPFPFISPFDQGIFDPHHARTDFTTATAAAQSFNSRLPSVGQKRALPTVSAQGEGSKRQKLEARDKRFVDRQVGARQADHRSVTIAGGVQAMEVNAGNGNPSSSFPAANQQPKNAVTHPIHVTLLDRPRGVSSDEFMKQLQATIAAERDASSFDR